jgi:hypothetical protein
VAWPPDFAVPNLAAGRAASSKDQAVGDLFGTLRLEPGSGTGLGPTLAG